MSFRRRFVLALVAFVVALTAIGSYLSWRFANDALEAELDEKAASIAEAAVATGLQASEVVGLQPGFEDLGSVGDLWSGYRYRLVELQGIVSEAYIVRPAEPGGTPTAIVSNFPADSVPIGAPLPFLEQYELEMARARLAGSSSTDSFIGNDGRFYKWGFASLEDQRTVLAVLMPADYNVSLDVLRTNMLVATVIAAALAALLAGLLATSIVRPIERLSHVALRIQRGHMEEPVAREGDHEVGRLSRAMERMRIGILERDEQLRLMLAQVAHEIRNPLGGLELFASEATETEDAAERRRLLERIRSEIVGLNVIISDFLTFARPVDASRQATDIRRPIGEAVELARAEVDDKGGTLLVELPGDPLMARVADDHVKRVVLNLLRNAAQAADHVELSVGLKNGEVVITVADDGPGVPPHLRARVFDPFYTDKEQGAGLGLAIVKKIAEAHGGRVELDDSAETNGGWGAVFHVYFGSLEDPPDVVTPTARSTSDG